MRIAGRIILSLYYGLLALVTVTWAVPMTLRYGGHDAVNWFYIVGGGLVLHAMFLGSAGWKSPLELVTGPRLVAPCLIAGAMVFWPAFGVLWCFVEVWKISQQMAIAVSIGLGSVGLVLAGACWLWLRRRSRLRAVIVLQIIITAANVLGALACFLLLVSGKFKGWSALLPLLAGVSDAILVGWTIGPWGVVLLMAYHARLQRAGELLICSNQSCRYDLRATILAGQSLCPECGAQILIPCFKCKYNLIATIFGHKTECPECGQPIPENLRAQTFVAEISVPAIQDATVRRDS